MESIGPDSGGFVSMLVLDMDAYTKKYGEKAVRKNLAVLGIKWQKKRL